MKSFKLGIIKEYKNGSGTIIDEDGKSVDFFDFDIYGDKKLIKEKEKVIFVREGKKDEDDIYVARYIRTLAEYQERNINN